MKTNSILIKEGKAFAVCEEIPDEQVYKDGDGKWINYAGYKIDLQRVKDNAVEFKDQAKAKSLNLRGDDLKAGKFYPIAVEVEIIEACAYDCCPYNAGCQFCREPKRLARIVEEPAIEKIDRFIMDKLIKYPPKVEEPEEKPCQKCRTYTPEHCHSMNCPMRKEEKQEIHSIHCPAYTTENLKKRFYVPGECNCKTKKDSEVEDQEELKEKIEFIKTAFQIYVGHDTTKQLEEFLKFSQFSITRIKQ